MSQKQYSYGIHTVKSLLNNQAEAIEEVICSDGKLNQRLQPLIDLAKHKNIPVSFQANDELSVLSNDGRHQGIVAVLSAAIKQQSKDLFVLLEEIEKPALLLILDSVQDPHNLGACLRTADGFGVDAVIVPKDKAVGLTDVVRKVACGAAETMPFYQVTNLARTLDQLKEAGVWLVGTTGETQTTISEIDLTGSIAIVMGAEGKGLRRLTKEKCDYLAKIPMYGNVESFNVSVATGVSLYEATKQRQK